MSAFKKKHCSNPPCVVSVQIWCPSVKVSPEHFFLPCPNFLLLRFPISDHMAEETAKQRLWDGVLELTKVAQEKGTDPLIWAMQLSSTLTTAGVSMPSVELADLLVSHICWSNNHPIAWKFLEKALTVRIVPPMLVLALLSTRSLSSHAFLLLNYDMLLYLYFCHDFYSRYHY